MLKNKNLSMRIIHRYLGFFLAGIMFVYALSGIVLIYRDVDTFKVDTTIKKQLETNLDAKTLSKKIRIRDLKFTETKGTVAYFKNGTYNITTGEVIYIKKQLPYILGKLTKLHKADTNDPLYWLNIFFGCSLLFFVVSAFWMFKPKTKMFNDGLIFSLTGFALVLILLFV